MTRETRNKNTSLLGKYTYNIKIAWFAATILIASVKPVMYPYEGLYLTLNDSQFLSAPILTVVLLNINPVLYRLHLFLELSDMLKEGNLFK